MSFNWVFAKRSSEEATRSGSPLDGIVGVREPIDDARIAQELYDSLMKGFFAVSNHLHMAVDQLPSDSPEAARFESIAQLADRVLEEGRLVFEGLRSVKQQYFASLGEALAAIPSEFGFSKDVKFSVIVEGRERELSAALWEEVYRICREAIVNAYRHSQAKRIEACIEYRASVLRIAVRDDGCGFDPQKLVTDRNAHWGLQVIHERAARLGGQLQAWSRAGAGTEIELKIQGSIAYGTSAARWWRRPQPEKQRSYEPGSGTRRDQQLQPGRTGTDPRLRATIGQVLRNPRSRR